MENVPEDLLDFTDNEDFYDMEKSNKSLDEDDNQIHSYTVTSQETMFIFYICLYMQYHQRKSI